MKKLIDLGYCAKRMNLHHEKAVKAWRINLFHAIWCGRYLWKAKAAISHGGFGPWLDENFKGSRRTARVYMQLAKRHKQIPDQEYAQLTIRDGLRNLSGKVRVPKSFDPDALIRSQAFKEFLRTLFKHWQREEIQELKSSLGTDPELEALVVKTMKKARYCIQEGMGKVTIPMRLEVARQNLQRRLWTNWVN